MMRKSLAVITAGLMLAVTLAACSSSKSGSSSPGSTSGAPGSSAASGSTATGSAPLAGQVPAQYRNGITVAVQTSQPPYSLNGSSGALTGEDVDMFNAIGALLGIKVSFVGTSFENMLLGVGERKYDVIPQTNVNRAREAKFDQLEVSTDGYTLMTLSDGVKIGPTLDDLCGHTLATLVGDAVIADLNAQSTKCTQEGKKAITQQQLPSAPAEYLAVASGRAEAAVANTSVLGYFLTQKSKQIGHTWKLTGPKFLTTPVGYTFPKGSSLVPVVQSAVRMLIQNGTYANVLAKWGMSNNAIPDSEVAINPPVSS